MAFSVPGIKIPIIGTDEFSKVLNGVSKRIEKTGKKLSSAGKAMTLGLTAPIAGLGLASTKASMNMNKAMANIGTLIPGQTERLVDLKKAVQDVSLETGKFTGDTAAGLFQIISAYGDSADTVKLLEINTKAAVAGVSTVKDSIDLTSAVTKAFGDTSAEATQKVVDLAFTTNKLGQTTFGEMAGALPRVTALSNKLGVSMEEMFAVMATATGVTGNTNEVSTQLASVLGGMVKPTKDMEIAFKKLGVRSGEELVRSRGLAGAMQALKDVTEKYQVPLGKVIGRKEGLILTYSLLGEQSEKYKDSLQEMNVAMGAQDEAFKEQTEGINKTGFAWNQFRVKIEVAAQKLGDKLAPGLEKALGPLSKMLDAFTQLGPKTQGVIILSLLAVAALGPLAFLVGQTTLAVSGLTAAMAWFSGAQAARVLLFVKGLALRMLPLLPIALLIGAAILIWNNNLRMLAESMQNIKDAFSSWKMFFRTMKNFFFDWSPETMGSVKDQIFNKKGKSTGTNGEPLGAKDTSAAAAGGGSRGSGEKSHLRVDINSAVKGVQARMVEGMGDVNIDQLMGPIMGNE